MQTDTVDAKSFWKYRKHYSIGLFTDLNLYYEALVIAKHVGYINILLLEKNLLERVKGLKYIETFKKRTFQDLIRELNVFKFIYKKDFDYFLTPSGIKLIDLYRTSTADYRTALLQKMNEEYVIPAWFINRLWNINPEGQGQVVIPSPIKTWKPSKQKWRDNKWSFELDKITSETHRQINNKLPDSFPISLSVWMSEVRKEYERLGMRKQRRVAKKPIENIEKKMEYFAPRGRLTLAMKSVSVNLLFGNKFINNTNKDFLTTKDPINSRTFMVWCPRLESFELLYYSDFFEEIPGRLIYPCSVFKSWNQSSDFKAIEFIKSPDGRMLYLHKPNWVSFKEIFYVTLNEVYQGIYDKEGIIYVSLQQVRDEVCRLLRISAAIFERFLELAFRESIQRKIDYSIALETDIREDQKSGYQIQRRAVYIGSIPHSLIAIKSFL